MPKKVRKAIAGPRAKKKKMEQAEAVEDEADDVEEGEEAEYEIPPAPEPSAAPAPNADSDALPMPPPMHVTLEQERQDALVQVETVHRRWRKTIDTHFNTDNGAHWKTPSELNRVLQRLQHADDERDKAFDQYERCRLQCVRYRTWRTLTKQARAQPDKLVIARMRDEAKARYDTARRAALSHGLLSEDEPVKRPHGGLDVHGAIELVAKEVGLVQAYQLVPLSQLRLGMDDSESPEALAEAKAQANVRYREMLRERIEGALQAEKEGRRTRSQRTLMLAPNWGDRSVIIDILREMGECVCRRPGIEREEDRCEICRAEGKV